MQADKANIVSARTYGGSFGLVGANGVVALASDEGASKILVAQSDSKKNSVFRGQTASLQATTRPAVTAETGSLSVALLGSASASVATASAKGEAGVQIADGTTSMLTRQKSQPAPKARMEKTTVKPRSRALQRPVAVRLSSIRQQPIRTSIQR